MRDRARAGHFVYPAMMKNDDGVLPVDGDEGNRMTCDLRVYMKIAAACKAERVRRAVADLSGTGKTLYRPKRTHREEDRR